ncbi:MAG: DNA-3-methyladenine glycosylase 2 family protein [Corynebacteriales bacterium]|nr:DNA-3-methyladenine glycosylase 2 family protein [Mycobacteriales bacterium]
MPLPDPDLCYRALASRDARFDGWFFAGVTSTGIFCRPSCPATKPRRENTRFYPSAAAAINAGFRACLRCRPDAVPGSPEWNVRTDVVARGMRLIASGIESVDHLAQQLGYSTRQLGRLFTAELGVGPLAVARTQRAQTARILIETTAMPFTEVAFAAGFSSIRQFNDTIRAIFGRTPSELRQRAGNRPDSTAGITLRLPYRSPLDSDTLFAFLAARAIPGIEQFTANGYRRVLTLAHGTGIVELTPQPGHIHCRLALADVRDLAVAVARVRRLCDLDADPVAIDEALSEDPALAPSIRNHPGMRLPGAADPHELAIRAVLGQQISVAAARTLARRLAERYGTPLDVEQQGLTRQFPTAEALASADSSDWPMPIRRRQTLQILCAALADGEVRLDAGADPHEAQREMMALPGIGPWTASYITIRALSAPDTFLSGDLGVRRGAAAIGLPSNPRELATYAERWRPYRSYAVFHLWNALTYSTQGEPT